MWRVGIKLNIKFIYYSSCTIHWYQTRS